MTIKRYGTSCTEHPEGIYVLHKDYLAIPDSLTDDDIKRALVAWFDPHHPDQEDFAARMRKAIGAAFGKEQA
jgi:hypothetical protein